MASEVFEFNGLYIALLFVLAILAGVWAAANTVGRK